MLRALLLGGVASITVFAASPVLAQEEGGAEEAAPVAGTAEEGERILVTGSRLRRTVYDSAAPIQVITREESTLAGFNTASEILQGLSVTGGNAQINNSWGGFVVEGGPGVKTVGLRGLGAGRTLVLINGRRVTPAGTRGAVGAADLNVLPSAMIERIEILRDGASSIYGSDAVAGVINVITRNVDGVVFEGQYNRPNDEGGTRTRGSLVAGGEYDNWSIQGSVEYYEQSELRVGDRDWATCNSDYRLNRATGVYADYIDPLTGRPKCHTITSQIGSNGVTINTIGTAATAGVPAAGNPVLATYNRWRPNAGVAAGLVGYEGVSGGSLNVRDTFDPDMLNRQLISPSQIYTGFGEFNYEFDFGGEFYTEVLYNNRLSEQRGYRQLSLDYARLGGGNPLLPAPLNALAAFQAAPSLITNGNPIQIRGFIGFGNDKSWQDVKYVKATSGLRGEFDFLPGWAYDINYTLAKSDASYSQYSWLTDRMAASLNLVLAPGGTPASQTVLGWDGLTYTCLSNTAGGLYVAGSTCVPAPRLSSDVIGGTLPEAWKNYTFVPVTGNTEYWENTFSVNVDGPLFELPAGDVLFGLGLDHKSQEIDDTPDPNSVANNLYNLSSSTPTRGTDAVIELYAEVEIPLLADFFLAKELTVNGSIRHTDYRSYGSEYTYKLQGIYAPVEWLSFRATKGTSYRAPALFEQFLGPTTSFSSAASDPCNNWDVNPSLIIQANCGPGGEGLPIGFSQTSSITVIGAGGAATGLEAETSDNFTWGVVFEPDFTPEWMGMWQFAVDYFDIEVNNGVERVGAFEILARCYGDPLFRANPGGFCTYVRPRGFNGNPVGLAVDDNFTNVATATSEGYDFNLRWTKDFWGAELVFNGTVTKYLSQTEQKLPNSTIYEYNGSLTSPEHTGTFDVTLTMNEWRLRYGVEWTEGQDSTTLFLTNGVAVPANLILDVPDYYLHSTSVQYNVTDDWSVTVGMRNIFDEEPPKISVVNPNAFSSYPRFGESLIYSGYDYYGRETFVNVTKAF